MSESEWQGLSPLAKMLGVSRRSIDRALDSDGALETDRGIVQVERRAAAERDYNAGVPRQTKTVARVVPSGEQPASPDPSEMAELALSGRGSAEETLAWLERIRRGDEIRVFYTSKGDRVEGDYSDMAQLRAASDAQKLREYIDDRDRNYIPCDEVEGAMVALASMLSHRLAAIPSRVAAELSGELREPLVVVVDEIRTELGDESERLLTELLGER